MINVCQLSDTDLQIALASSFRIPWKNLRLIDGRLMGEGGSGISEIPIQEVPNWPMDTRTASFLEDVMKAYGLHHEYLHNLSIASSDKTAARRMSEAALVTLRNDAPFPA